MKRILVMGAGLIGARHIASVAAHPECVLAGIVDPDPGLALKVDTPIIAQLEQVDCDVDGVIIATPTDLHGDHGTAVAERGWHMLIEKPVAATVAQASDLHQVAQRCAVRCLVGHHRRYHPAVQTLRDMVQGGQIGAPVTSTLIWSMRKPDAYFVTDWRRTGGSPVMINLVHDIDLLRHVLGEVETIAGLGANGVRLAGRVESGAVALRFASGASGTISFADTAPSPWGFEAAMGENPNIATTGQDMWWITGTAGAIAFPSLTLWSGANDWSQAPKPLVTRAHAANPLVRQLDHFIEVIDDRCAPLVGLEDATETLRVTRQIEDLLSGQIA